MSSAVAQLCPACGLCCNGVLFKDVELERGDDLDQLASLGLVLKRKGQKMAFAQPCACYDGQFCRAYADRPSRCRTFECRLLSRVQNGELTVRSALRKIARARTQVQGVRELIQTMGGSGQGRALTPAYAKLMARPIDLAEPGTARRSRSKLATLMHKLMLLVHLQFLT